VPKINFQAKDYYKLIDWSDITDPPILSHLHAAVIQEKVRKNDFSFIDDFLSHTPCEIDYEGNIMYADLKTEIRQSDQSF